MSMHSKFPTGMDTSVSIEKADKGSCPHGLQVAQSRDGLYHARRIIV